ncbi:DUF4192 domain-containing protein [Nocardioides sp.]|uniref:DUF4192 domain-containing protein n=1 Tax=Nocardioides sp. TaxID=35761 RepID=UPI0039E22C50
MTLTFKARTPEDILAVAPVILGFEPEQSVVMLTFGGRHSFHARMDLPEPADVEDCVSGLLDPALAHAVATAVFVIYDGSDLVAQRIARALRRRFEAADIEVLEVLHAAGGRYYCPLGRRGVPAHGVPYDVSAHPFRARAAFGGLVTEPSRAALAARLEPSPSPVPLALIESAVPLAGPELRDLIEAHLGAETLPCDEEAAAMLRAVGSAALRHHAWFGISRHEAARHVRLWTDLVTRAPESHLGSAAAVLGFVAWMHGDGAFAWCAVDRALAAEPDNGLAHLVSDMLCSATPPRDDWDEMFPAGIPA